MKKLILLSLVLVLSACTSATEVPSIAPTDVLPTSTPVVLVQTVVVEATQAATEVPPTAVPATEVPATPVVVTVVVEPTQAAATQPPAVAAQPSDGLVTVDAVLGAGYFTEMTRNASQLSLRCQLVKEVTFKVKPLVDTITQVQFYYRIVDRSTGAAFEWQNFGKMIPEADGTFSLVFNGEQVNADSRRPNAWLDYQFVGLSKTGDVVGRTEKIEKQITYTFECP
jgi:ABC-type transport system substrate-binding protein